LVGTFDKTSPKAFYIWALFKSVPIPSRGRDLQLNLADVWVDNTQLRPFIYKLFFDVLLRTKADVRISALRRREFSDLERRLGNQKSVLFLLPIMRNRLLCLWLFRVCLCWLIKRRTLLKLTFSRLFDFQQFHHHVYRILNNMRNDINTRGWSTFILSTVEPQKDVPYLYNQIVVAVERDLLGANIDLSSASQTHPVVKEAILATKKMYVHHKNTLLDSINAYTRKTGRHLLEHADTHGHTVDTGVIDPQTWDDIINGTTTGREYQIQKLKEVRPRIRFKARQFSTVCEFGISFYHAKYINRLVIMSWLDLKLRRPPDQDSLLVWLTAMGASDMIVNIMREMAISMPTVDTQFQKIMYDIYVHYPYTFSLFTYLAYVYKKTKDVVYFPTIELKPTDGHISRESLVSNDARKFSKYEIRLCPQCLNVTIPDQQENGYKIHVGLGVPSIQPYCIHMNVVPHKHFKSTRLVRISLQHGVLMVKGVCYFVCNQPSCNKVRSINWEINRLNKHGWFCDECN
jgi:hypothetical protein